MLWLDMLVLLGGSINVMVRNCWVGLGEPEKRVYGTVHVFMGNGGWK